MFSAIGLHQKRAPNAEDGAAVAVESHHSRPRKEVAQWLVPAHGLLIADGLR